jgi:hypothetical protein
MLAIEKAIRTGRPQRIAPSERPRLPTPGQVRMVEPTRKRLLVNVATPGG